MHAPENAEAIEGCLSAACRGVRVEIGEIWKRESKQGSKYSPVHVFASETTLETFSRVLVGSEIDRTRKHKLSPQLCDRAMRQKVPLWYTTADVESPLHPDMPIKTAIVIPTFNYEIQQEFYVLFFSFKIIESSSSSMGFLRYLAKAAVVACGVTFHKPLMDTINPPTKRREAINDVSVVCTQPDLPNTFVQWTDLHQVERLVDGGTSIVYTATYNQMPVIVKILREDCERNELRVREIRGEIELMQSFNHPNIVQYIASGQEPRTFVVMERLEGGSLNQRLGFAPTHTGVHRHSFFTKDVRKAFSYELLLKYALQLAEALRYMHEDALPGFTVMHRDLKPDNIGFKADGTIKLMDFGLAKAIPKDVTERAKHQMTGETGSIRYMAPEVALHKQYNEKADVFSWSFIVWEMATLTKPFQDYTKEDFFNHVMRGGERPILNKKWPRDFCELLKESWSENPNLRPSFRDIVQRLGDMEKSVQAQSKKAKFFLLLDRRSSWF